MLFIGKVHETFSEREKLVLPRTPSLCRVPDREAADRRLLLKDNRMDCEADRRRMTDIRSRCSHRFGHEVAHAKPVAFVSYGGVSGGLRAVEQLRQVFAELHAVTIRESVSFAGAWEQFDANGALQNPQRAERSMDAMLRRVRWWAAALAQARRASPYAQSA